MKMKAIVFAALAAATSAAVAAQDGDVALQAIQAAVADAKAAIAVSPISKNATIAVLPVRGDVDDRIAGQLKIAIGDAGRKCVADKDDPVFAEILKEVEWDQRKDDILDPSTLVKFGKLQAAQILMTANVRDAESTPRYAFFSLELHAYDIATKAHVWGGEFSRRIYKPGFEEVGRVGEIPTVLAEAIAGEMRKKIEASLKAAPKLAGVKKVAFLPLADDVKGYVLTVVRSAFSGTGMSPANLDIATLGEARILLRDKPGSADAVLHGSLRDLSCEPGETGLARQSFRYRAEVQLRIEKPDGTELWSDTVSVTAVDLQEAGLWGKLCVVFPSLNERPWLVAAVPLGVILALFALCKILGAMTRVR